MANWFTNTSKTKQTPSISPERMAAIKTLPFRAEEESGLIAHELQHVVQQFHTSVENQIEILKLALAATSVVVLWTDVQERISIYAYSSQCPASIVASFPSGTGVIGALKGHDDIVVAPFNVNSPAVPYYRTNVPVGGFVAHRIASSSADGLHYGVLCIDRKPESVWSAVELRLIASTAEQITRNLYLTRDLLFTNVERRVLQLVFSGLQMLNSALDLESVYTAANNALQLVVDADLFAVSLIVGNEHKICYLEGSCPNLQLDQTYKLEDSIVGQVVKYRRTLPERFSRSGRAPIVNGLKLFDLYRSVMVVPLFQDDTPVTGVLIIASRDDNQFPRDTPEKIEMLAAQVAIKIDLARAHEKIQQLAITDPLTKIANRRAFKRGFAAMYERARRRQGSFSLIICDIDLFKRINDVYGHPFGDIVIQQVAGLLNDVVRTGDLAARIGGEEFAILLEDTGLRGAMDVAERLRLKVEALKLMPQGEPVVVTISLGVAVFPKDCEAQDKLFKYADQALYKAKNKGRNCSVAWGSSGRYE